MKIKHSLAGLAALAILILSAAWTTHHPLKVNGLEGIYTDQNNTIYYLTQVNNEVLFVGENPGRGFAHVFAGKINGNQITGEYLDIPKYGTNGRGAATFERSSSTKLKGLSGSFKNLILSKTNFHAISNRLPLPTNPSWSGSGTGDVTGTWRCNDGGRYYIRQMNEWIVWFGEKEFKRGEQPLYANLGIGKRSGPTLFMQFFDLHKGQTRNMGKINIHVTGANALAAIESTLKWTRIEVKQANKPAEPNTVRVKHAKPPSNPPQTKQDNSKLIVYYNGYSYNNKLYIKNLKSGNVQARTIKNGKVEFNLSPDGGKYHVCRDANPPKSEESKPRLVKLREVTVGKKETKTIRF
ncbi:MAG: hypothetical protein R2792_01535 [Saprospiraceae bacterium]|jgi:hypothetical protein